MCYEVYFRKHLWTHYLRTRKLLGIPAPCVFLHLSRPASVPEVTGNVIHLLFKTSKKNPTRVCS